MARERDSWQRWVWAWHTGFFLLLWGAAATSLLDQPSRSAIALGGAAAISLWYWLLWTRVPERRSPRMAIMLWGCAAGALALSYVDMFFLAPAGFLTGHLLSWLPLRWAVGSVAAIGLAIGVRFTEYFGAAGLIFGGLSAAVSIFLGLFIESIISQSERRSALIDELESTRAQLAAAERQAGAAAERSRMAREVHDTVIQDLISVARLVESARRSLQRAPDEADRHLQLAEGAAREGLAEARRLVNHSRPPALQHSNLPDALERVCSRFSAESGVSSEVVIPSQLGELPPETEVALLRATQEALANVHKHAKARSVSVTITRMSDRVMLDVRDDGAGFDTGEPDRGRDSGFGLIGLRERVRELGGEVAVESGPGEGTTLCVQVPLPAASPEQERP